LGGAGGGRSLEHFLLYQGALNEGRGIEALITAMQYIDNRELWLAGEGDLSEALRALVQKMNVTDKVKFLGRVSPDELKKLTKKAYIGLNLLENRGLSYYYSLANKTFDYVQAGVPSINMAFPEYQRLNEEYEVSLLINDLEVKTILDALKILMYDKEKYQQLQNNCKKAALVWNWEQEAKKLLDFYQKI
jgi:glycosyltransferase involved in cell wall biosynthesis